LRRLLGELHGFDLVSVGIVWLRLPVAAEADDGLAVYAHGVLAQVLGGRVQVIGQQADVPEALLSARVGGGPPGKTLIERLPEGCRYASMSEPS
jgi:hypothetical protein